MSIKIITLSTVIFVSILGCDKPNSVQFAPTAHYDPTTEDFVTTWKITDQTLIIQTGYTEQVKGGFDYQVDWDNDGVFDEQHWTGPATHTYKAPGIYTVRVRGRFPHAELCHYDKEKKNALLAVEQWGKQQWKSMTQMFDQCNVFVLRATDQPNLVEVTNMWAMFRGAKAFDQPIDSWDTSNITNMAEMFSFTNFNQPLGSWNTSKVESMVEMFKFATKFNQPLNSWNTSNVRLMDGMFQGTHMFNQPIDSWDTSNVESMYSMFALSGFNQPIGSWNTSNVKDMEDMFLYAKQFDQPLDSWDISNVKDMRQMFKNAPAFNQPLLSWRVTSDVKVKSMFKGAKSFQRRNIRGWSYQSIRESFDF